MKRRNKIVTMVTVSALSTLLVGNTVWAVSNSAKDYDYTVHADHVEITKYIGEDTEVIIPEIIEGLPVTTIADKAFYGGAAVKEVYLPDSVETVMSTTFDEKVLKKVYGSSSSIAVTLAEFFGIEFEEGIIVDAQQAEKEAKAKEEAKDQAEAEAKAKAEEEAKAQAEEEAKAQAEAEAKAKAEEEAKAQAEAETKAKAEEEAKAQAEETEAKEENTEVAEDSVDMVAASNEVRYIMEESAEKILTEEDVKDLEAQIISYSKMEILARKGMLFESEEIAGYFENQSWYFGFISQEEFPLGMLNDCEIDNLIFLEDLENTAGEDRYIFDEEGYNYDLLYAYLEEKYAEKAEAEVTEEESKISEKEVEQKDDENYFTMSKNDSAYAKEEAEVKAKAEAEAKAKAEAEAKAKAEAEAKAKAEEEFFEITVSEEQVFQNQTSQNQMQQEKKEYIFKDSNSRYLTREEVQVLSQQALCYAKNEIYARHGRKFMSVELQEYFNSKSWYKGNVDAANFSQSVFNDYEIKNIDLLVEYEFAISSSGYLLDQPGYDITRVNK